VNQDLKCPKCQGSMVQGFMPDYASNISKYVISWAEGKPERSWWEYTKVPMGGGIPIGVFRCKGCGYLEFYAQEKFAVE